MPFVQRDSNNNVIGLYANLQPGFAEESLADTDPAVTGFLAAQQVPIQVSAMQAKVALSRAGLLPQVQAWMNTATAEQQLIWNNAQTFSRNSALLAQVATALGLSSAQVDALFTTAAGINP